MEWVPPFHRSCTKCPCRNLHGPIGTRSAHRCSSSSNPKSAYEHLIPYSWATSKSTFLVASRHRLRIHLPGRFCPLRYTEKPRPKPHLDSMIGSRWGTRAVDAHCIDWAPVFEHWPILHILWPLRIPRNSSPDSQAQCRVHPVCCFPRQAGPIDCSRCSGNLQCSCLNPGKCLCPANSRCRCGRHIACPRPNP